MSLGKGLRPRRGGGWDEARWGRLRRPRLPPASACFLLPGRRKRPLSPSTPLPLSRVDFLSCRFGSPFVLVGAGVGMMQGGDACVALVLFPRAPASSCQGDASVPTPHPSHSRPYEYDACPQKPTSESTSPAPTGTPFPSLK